MAQSASQLVYLLGKSWYAPGLHTSSTASHIPTHTHTPHTRDGLAVWLCHAGLPQDEATAQGFWDLFYTNSLSPDNFHFAVGSGQPFTVVATLQSIYTQTPRTLVVDFR